MNQSTYFGYKLYEATSTTGAKDTNVLWGKSPIRAKAIFGFSPPRTFQLLKELA